MRKKVYLKILHTVSKSQKHWAKEKLCLFLLCQKTTEVCCWQISKAILFMSIIEKYGVKQKLSGTFWWYKDLKSDGHFIKKIVQILYKNLRNENFVHIKLESLKQGGKEKTFVCFSFVKKI